MMIRLYIPSFFDEFKQNRYQARETVDSAAATLKRLIRCRKLALRV